MKLLFTKSSQTASYDWAPAGRRIRPEYEAESDDGDDDDKDEIIARERVRRSLNQLDDAVNQLGLARSLIGHNKPPELLIDVPYTVEDEETIRQIIVNVREQTEAEPLIDSLASSRQFLTELCGKVGTWISQKSNLAADEAAKSFGKTIGRLAAAGVAGALAAAIYNLWAALQGAASAIADWISVIQLPF